jgi:hypothetical protein
MHEFTCEFVQQWIIEIKGIEQAAENYEVYRNGWSSFRTKVCNMAHLNRQASMEHEAIAKLRSSSRYHDISHLEECRKMRQHLWALCRAVIPSDAACFMSMQKQ